MSVEQLDTAPAGVPPQRVGSVGGASIDGERDIPSVNERRSVQNRVNNLLALCVVSLVGGGFLYVYYANLAHKREEAKAKLVQEHTQQSTGDMKLPPLGAVENPKAGSESSGPPDRGPTVIADVLGSAPPIGSAGSVDSATPAATPNGPPVKTPEQLATERQLTPSVFLRGSETVTGTAASAAAAAAIDPPAGDRGSLNRYLTPTVAPATHAQVLATRRFIIPKGNFLDCTLETAINSELPGLATCVTAFDTFGADGKVVLLERGSKLVGETRGQVAQGMSRLFIVWTEARTPTGVVVELDSPGTDELGRAGVTGTVNNHFWGRFGAALLVTVIDGTLQGVAQHQQTSGSTVVLNPQGGQQVIDDILRNTINIPPTISINPGARVQVIVARDVDFRSVYELRTGSP
jgi:type IV secretion system protein VirB10